MKTFKPSQKVTTVDSDSNEVIDGIVLSATPESVTVQWDDVRDPVTHYQDEFEDIKISITNALQAIHAIALKKGFAAEDIKAVWESIDGHWAYRLETDGEEFFINLKPE